MSTTQDVAIQTDMVTLTVADGHGATDALNFIFNVEETPAQPVTLTFPSAEVNCWPPPFSGGRVVLMPGGTGSEKPNRGF